MLQCSLKIHITRRLPCPFRPNSSTHCRALRCILSSFQPCFLASICGRSSWRDNEPTNCWRGLQPARAHFAQIYLYIAPFIALYGNGTWNRNRVWLFCFSIYIKTCKESSMAIVLVSFIPINATFHKVLPKARLHY